MNMAGSKDVVVKALIDYDKLDRLISQQEEVVAQSDHAASTSFTHEPKPEAPKDEQEKVAEETKNNANAELQHPEEPNDGQCVDMFDLLKQGSQRKKAVKLLKDNTALGNMFSQSELKELLRSAFTRSRKKVPREDEFYRFIYNHGLHKGNNIVNKNKMARYTNFRLRKKPVTSKTTESSNWWD